MIGHNGPTNGQRSVKLPESAWQMALPEINGNDHAAERCYRDAKLSI